MDTSHKPFSSHQQLFSELLSLTQSNSTGTLIINSNDSKMTRVVLEGGEITSITHNELKGLDALPVICAIKDGSYSFVDDLDLGTKQADLPGTDEILDMLKVEASFQSGSDKYDDLIGNVQFELTKHVGPIAGVLVEEYLDANGSPDSLDDFGIMLEKLSSKIPDTEKADQFTIDLMTKAKNKK